MKDDEFTQLQQMHLARRYSSTPFLLWFREPSLTSGFVADIDADVLCARLARGLNRLSIVKIEAFEAQMMIPFAKRIGSR